MFKMLLCFMNITALWFLVEQIQERPTILFKAIFGGELGSDFGFFFMGLC